MTIIVGGGGASSGSSGAISGGFKIFELMFNQSTGAALPDGTLRPAIFADKAAMQAYFTQHPTEFTRLKASGRVCEIGTIDAQGKPLTINNEAYSYVEGESDPWVDVVGGLVGPKGDKGPAGDVSNLKVDYPLTINTVADETTLGAPEAITFKGGKIGEQYASLDLDIERETKIRLVTDTPSVAYNVVGAYKDAAAPQGYYTKLGSQSLTTYLTSKGDIKTDVDGVDGVVYTSQNPQPITVADQQVENIRLNESGLYSTYKAEDKEATLINRAPFSRTYNFNQSLTLDEPYDGVTAIYTTQDPEVDHVLHLELDPTDPRLHKDWIFTVAVDGDTASTLEVKVGKTTPKTYKVPAGFIVIELSSDQSEFVVHQMDTPIGIEGSDYANLTNVEWKNLPTKEYIVTEGTLGGFGTGIDGKTGRLHVKVLNNAISASDTSWFIRHEITILSDDPDLSGRMFLKVAKSKDVFDAAKLVEVTGGLSQITENTPLEAVNPVDGSTHDAVNVTNNELRFGSPTFKTEIRSSEDRIPVSIRGGAYDEHIAYLSDISGSGADPSKGFTLEKGSDIKATLQDGSSTTDLIGLASNADNLLIGSEKLDTIIEAKTGAYVNVNGGVKKVLLEGDTPSGSVDTAGFGTVNEIPERLHPFTTHEANIQASYQDDDFEVKFANGEAGPVFEVRVTEDGKSVWELGFDYAEKITEFDQVLGRVLIQYEPSKSTIPAKQFFDLVTLSCSKGQVKTFKKIHNNQDMAEFWVVANANNTDSRYQLSFDMQGQGEGVAEFLVKPPKFVDYVIPWDQNRLPPQILLHQEGMNNQGKMGSGSNIDSGSVRQGKVYVEDFTPANGGVPGLVTEDEKKGFVIKWYGINDSESAGVFFFFNFAGDVYSKMNKSQGEKGNWEKLNNYADPQPIVPPMIDPDNPLEVQGADGSIHDAIGVTSAGKMTIGTPSEQITELMIATGQERIAVNRDKSGVQTLESLAYLSDVTSLRSPEIQWQSIMDATPIASGEYILKATDKINGGEVKAGDNDLLTLTYKSSSQYVYTLQLGMVKAHKERTGEDYEFYESVVKWNSSEQQYQVDVTESSNQKALDFSINAEGKIKLDQTVINKGTRGIKTFYFRESEYTITEEDIQKDIVIQAEPFVADSNGHYSTTVTFPSIDVFTKYYYIPQVNEAQKDTLPHIENLNIQCWLDPEGTRKDQEHRLYLKSTGDSVAWGTSTMIGDNAGCFIHRPANDTKRNYFVSFNFMHIHTGGTSTGPMMGYTAQSADEDNVFSLTTTPPAPPVVRDDAVNVTYFTAENSDHYESLNRQYPVILDEDVVDGQLLWMTKSGTEGTDLPHVKGIKHAGEYASGIARSSGSEGDQIQSVTSGTFPFSDAYALFGDEVEPQLELTPYQRVYVSRSSGKLTAKNTGYIIGWILQDDQVLLDVDLYNAHASELGDGANSYATHFAGISTVEVSAGEGIVKETEIGLRNFLFDYDHALSGIALADSAVNDDVVCAVKGIFPAPAGLPISDQNAGDVIVLDSETNLLQWPSLGAEGSKIIGWYAGDNEIWIDVDMYNRFRDIERLASGGELGDDITVKKIIGKDSSGTGVEFVSTDTTLKAVGKVDIDINTETIVEVTQAGVKTNLPIDMGGQKITNVEDANENSDVPSWLQVKNYVAENGGGGGGGTGDGDIKWVGSSTGNHGLITFVEADDGKTLNALELTYGQVAGAVTKVGEHTTEIGELDDFYKTLASQVNDDMNALSLLKQDIEKQFELDEVTTLDALGITDESIHAVHGDRDNIAKIFKTGKVRDGNKYVLTMNEFVGKDLHGFLPTSTGGVFKVTSAHSYTHRDPSMTDEYLPPFKEHRVIFEWFDTDGGYYTAFLDQDDLFTDWAIVNDTTQVEANTADIANIKTDVSANTADISTLTTNVSTNTDELSDTKGKLAQIDVEVTKVENVIGIPNTQDINDLGITEQQVIDANGDTEAILRLFRNAKLNGASSEYHYVANTPEGNDFYGFLPDNNGGVFSIIQYVSLADPNEYYTLAQYISEENIVKRSVINFADSFDDWAAHSGGDSVVSLRNDFEKYKTVTNATIARLEETIGTLQTLIESAFNQQELTYSGSQLTSTMTNIKGETSESSVHISSSGGGGDVPDTFNVYVGWDSNDSVTAEEIKQIGEHGKVQVETLKSELLTKEFTTTRTLNDEYDYKFSFIAFPKNAVEPDPDQVNYNGAFPASWNRHEVLLDDMTYVVLMPEYANNESAITITLVQS